MKGSFLSKMRGWAAQATDFGKTRAVNLSQRYGKAVSETGVTDPNDTSMHVHVAKSYLKRVRDLMKGTDKTGSETEEQSRQDNVRSTGASIGTGVSHFLTGYAAGPWLHPPGGQRLTMNEFKNTGLKATFKKYWGKNAITPAVALTGAAMAGGYLKERIQAGYEHAHERKKHAHDGCEEIAAVNGEGGGETMRVSGNVTAPDWVKKERRRASGHEKKAAGIFVYQRDPSEVKETKHPGKPKGAAAAFGTRMSPRHALHKRDQEQAEGWMKGNAEFVELGDRPGIVKSFQTIVGTEKEQVLTRRDAQKLLGERDRIKLLCKEHRHGAKKGEVEYNPNTERDLLEVLDSVETILQNPKVQAIQVVER